MTRGRKPSSIEIDTERLTKWMKDRNVTKVELARAVGYSREAVTRSINNGRVDIMLLANICWYLDVPIDKFRREEKKA